MGFFSVARCLLGGRRVCTSKSFWQVSVLNQSMIDSKAEKAKQLCHEHILCISYRTRASVSVKSLWVKMLAFAVNYIEDTGNNLQSSDVTQRRHPSDIWLVQPRSAFGGILWPRNMILRFGLQSDTKTVLVKPSFYKPREITAWRIGESLPFTYS